LIVVAASAASDEEKAKLYNLIASYVIRRALCEGLSGKNYNNTFIRIAGRLKSNGVSCAAFAEAFADSDKDTVRFPGDDEFKTAITKHRQYGRIPQPRLKLILSELEMASRDQYDEAAGLQENLTIEHILPDGWTSYWKMQDGTKVPDDLRTGMNEAQLAAIEERESIKHTLGNLTLLTPPANFEAQNYDFEKKRPRLRTSLLAMNKDLADQTEWSEAEIHARAEKLANLAIALWAAPGQTT
jgi:hypothetical protein